MPSTSRATPTTRLPHEPRHWHTSFDLIDDYLIWVVFRAIKPIFGAAAGQVAAGVGGHTDDQGLQRQYLLQIRYVAGQLLGGGVATLDAQRRADVAADGLRARMKAMRSDIEKAWGVSMPPADVERNAVGMSWISHPVTVQSAALVVQELLSRPKIYRRLLAMAQAAEGGVWADDKFRDVVRDHVLELMRFRPVFPLLARNVPRDTGFETGGREDAECPAGGKRQHLVDRGTVRSRRGRRQQAVLSASRMEGQGASVADVRIWQPALSCEGSCRRDHHQCVDRLADLAGTATGGPARRSHTTER